MVFMNDFVDRELSSMRTFLQQISVGCWHFPWKHCQVLLSEGDEFQHGCLSLGTLSADLFVFIFQTDDNKMPPLEFDGFIDLGKELSILHSLLVESLEKMNEVGPVFLYS